MAYETKDNTGSLFKNDRRESEKHPNAKGKALIGGVWHWVSAWTKGTRGGDPYQSLSFEPMTEEQVAKYTEGGAERPASRPGREEQRGRQSYGQQTGSAAPAPRSAFRSPSSRPQQEAPFGDEQQFKDADIPFHWEGRQHQNI